MCGEKCALGKAKRRCWGSPPRVRGKAYCSCNRIGEVRITPACAGKSSLSSYLCFDIKDHPRVCGEKTSPCGCAFWRLGSPPRVRGKVNLYQSRRQADRITPACAGKRLKKAHKIKDFDPVPIRFHLVFRRFERWCSNLPTPDGNVPV